MMQRDGSARRNKSSCVEINILNGEIAKDLD